MILKRWIWMMRKSADEISSSKMREEEAYQEPQRESRRSAGSQSGNKVVNIHAAAQLQVVLAGAFR